MNIYILDKDLKVINTLSSKRDSKSSRFFNDFYTRYLEDGSEDFEFDSLDGEGVVLGNYVAFRYNEAYKLFRIVEAKDDKKDIHIKNTFAECAGFELKNNVLRPREIPGANIAQYLENVLGDTPWRVGYVDENITDFYTVNIDRPIKVYNELQNGLKLYDCELQYRVEMKNNRVVGKYVDVYKKRGTVTNYRLEYSERVDGIRKLENGMELYTGVVGTGKSGIDFKSVEWSKAKGDPCDKPLNQDFVADEQAFKKYSINGEHLMGNFDCDLESPHDVLHATYKYLKDNCNPKVSYEVDIAYFDIDKVDIGDTVYVIDNDFSKNPLHLSARVNELQTSFTDSTKDRMKISNFKVVKSKITDDMRDIKNQLDQVNNSTIYGIHKGGFLTSDLEIYDDAIHIKNKLLNPSGLEYFFDVKDKPQGFYMDDIMTYDSRYITQSFAIDFDNNHLYTAQVVTETNPEHILISKIDVSTREVLGYMKLHGFGHGSQIGIDKLNGYVSLWVECDGAPHVTTGKLFGTKICRIKFENGKEYTTHGGNVYDLIPDARNISVSIDEVGNRLCVKAITYANKNLFHVYDLKSVIENRPNNLAKIAIPSWLEPLETPLQGHSVCGNRIYHYQGSEKSVTKDNDARVTVLDFNANILESCIVNVGYYDDKEVREPEGIVVRNEPFSDAYQMYLGFSIGPWPNRKYNIGMYIDKYAKVGYEKRGSFRHPNGFVTDVKECRIDLLNATYKTYLLHVEDDSRFMLGTKQIRQFIIANVKAGKWYFNNVMFEPHVNDCVLAEIDKKNITFFVSNNDVNLPGRDANLLKWVDNWNNNKPIPGDDTVVSPKMLVGTVNENELPTGIAIGNDDLKKNTNFSGIIGYNNGNMTFHMRIDGSAVFGADDGRQIIIHEDGSLTIPGIDPTDIDTYISTYGEIKCTETLATNVYKAIRALEFRRPDGKAAYINGTGGGTLSNANALESAGVKSIATDMYLGVDGEVRVTDKAGYNAAGINYKNFRAYNLMAQNKIYQAGTPVSGDIENVSDIVLGANVRRNLDGGLITNFYTHSLFEEADLSEGTMDVGTQIALLTKTIQEQNALIHKLKDEIEIMKNSSN